MLCTEMKPNSTVRRCVPNTLVLLCPFVYDILKLEKMQGAESHGKQSTCAT